METQVELVSRIVEVARELRDDVSSRYPNQQFKCPIMRELDELLIKLDSTRDI